MHDHKIYSSKEVAKHLSIQPVTVRKYSQILESKGYSFTKDSNNWRLYSEDDIKTFKYLLSMRSAGHSVEDSADHVAGLYQANLSIARPDTTLQTQGALVEFIKQQQDINQQILERLDSIEKQQIERDQKLINALRHPQEAKKQVAAATRKKWWQFWK